MALGSSNKGKGAVSAPASASVGGRTDLASGFRKLSEQDVYRGRLIVSSEGLPKRGKTHFALTAPGPIAYQSIDRGVEGMGRKFIGTKTIHIAEYDFRIPLRAEEKGNQQIIDAANRTLEKFEADMQWALAETKSVVWDTATELWEMLMIAEFGKLGEVMPHHYAPLNARFRHWIDQFLESNRNLIMIHKTKDEWKTGANGKPSATGKQTRAGFKGAGYDAHVNIVHDRDFAPTDTDPNMPSGEFIVLVKDCRPNESIAGMVVAGSQGIEPTFAGLAQLVYPDSDPADWK
jgi:hypothetical protein